ncbi:Beta-N-acetylglucosaminidase [Virgibacillus subterraneus]|uniref:Beta-N-acetylglucosaminidase n=1 Tax=Virgibacillus subterraneus TaxID=621109 RepID=A0A1H9AFB3_9BACI|nr:SH3 domain-containing protein [Virgibacillus subterraneus]SEP75211.1 Beta-N-acetylglucosaminidase [Virgibacillus subterraneus]
MRKFHLSKAIIVSCFLALVLSLITIPMNNNTAHASTVHEGIALKDPTNIYTTTSRSNVLKSYKKGSILLYMPHSSNWYKAVVFVNGKRHTGYINKSDVETSVKDQEVIKGVGMQDPTAIYSEAATNSRKLKTYDQGSILYYKTYTSSWYEAIVYVNGKRHSGYIHKSHVENIIDDQKALKGIGLKSPTAVYSKASTSSSKLKSYGQGSVLYFKTFTNSWYEALIYINGNATTGYIHKSHVEEIVKDQEGLKGIGLKRPTAIYSKASTSSSKLKSYSQGSVLYYKTFTNNWYEALVYINGSPTTGYIHTNHVEGIYDTQEALKGRATAKPTKMYAKASRNSRVVKSYSEGSLLYFDTFSPNWHQGFVFVNGKRKTVYIHRKDVTTGDVYKDTNYDTSYRDVVDTQMSRAPQVWSSGGWVDASREQVAYYVNSSNFHKGDNSFFQFLNLSEPAGVNAKEINENILKNKGTLSGEAQAFISAANTHNINEIYLMAHALHETGNGSSDLAAGVPVDDNGNVVDKNKATNTVYNMYGIKAFDSCPIDCGAKHAFEQGWFTPEKAIIGGAAFIGNNYINAGQNTLYKMRWDPDSPGKHQYATDVAWAFNQTSNISNLYNSIDNYVLIFDIPVYEGQPDSSGDPNAYATADVTKYPSGVYGITDSGNDPLNFRDGPNGNDKGNIPDGTKLDVIGYNGSWLNVNYNNENGWVHGDYVNLLNLVKVTATNLNVRETPGGNSLGKVSNIFMRAVIDNNNNYVTNNEWYQVYYNGQKAWVSDGSDGSFIQEIK